MTNRAAATADSEPVRDMRSRGGRKGGGRGGDLPERMSNPDRDIAHSGEDSVSDEISAERHHYG